MIKDNPDAPLFGAEDLPELDQHRYEAQLRASKDRYRTLVDSLPQLVWTCLPDGRCDYLSRQWVEYTGMSEVEQLDLNWLDKVIHPDDRARTYEHWMGAVAGRHPYDIDYRIRRHDGTFRWFKTRGTPIRDEGDRISYWFGTCTDIEDIVAAREVLARSREELEQEVAERTAELDRVWRLSQDLFVLIGSDGRYESLNPAWTSALGYAREELIGMDSSALVHPEDLQSRSGDFEPLTRGEPVRDVDLRIRAKSGDYRWFNWTALPAGDGRIHAEGRDVTHRKELEEQLRQAQKMEAVGQLTGGIAHDFNNLLTGITGSLELLRRRLAQGRTAELAHYAEAAAGAAERAAALTHRLLAFSRRQPLDPKPVHTERLVASMEELLRRTLGETIELELTACGEPWPTLCDPHQLETALLNLAINARDAMPGGGRLSIEICGVQLDAADAGRDLRPGDYVRIAVADTGVGMPPEVVARAFDPFFTTKPIGQGTGLGLSMVYGFARQSGGQVLLRSQSGLGTTVELYLPRYLGEAEITGATLERPVAPLPHAGGEVVLVVEDEAAVRSLVVEVLQELGCTVLEAADGPAGLELIGAAAELDLLVTDVGLPGLNGRQLADAARRLRPELRVLFMTGYAENAAAAEGFLEPGMEMITKPFPLDSLATRIRRLLDPEPA